MKKNTHGGKRKGSGRKKLEIRKAKAPSRNLTVRAEDFEAFTVICKVQGKRKNAMFARLLEVYLALVK